MENDKVLTSQEREEFRELETMFQSPGWRRLKETMQSEVENGPAYWFANAANWEEIVAARARTRAVLELLNYEGLTENRKANLITGRNMQAAEDQEDSSLVGL